MGRCLCGGFNFALALAEGRNQSLWVWEAKALFLEPSSGKVEEEGEEAGLAQPGVSVIKGNNNNNKKKSKNKNNNKNKNNYNYNYNYYDYYNYYNYYNYYDYANYYYYYYYYDDDDDNNDDYCSCCCFFCYCDYTPEESPKPTDTACCW